MNIERLINSISKNPNFEVRKPCGYPQVSSRYILPDDLKEFYRLCGGIYFYKEYGGFPINIFNPKEVRPSNLTLLGENYDEDISSSWYLIADALDGNYISIDFNPSRLGKCYESFEYSHAMVDNCPIVALSFEQLLNSLLEYKGDYFFWKDNDKFVSLGDAYKNK
jgi:hypothetical protein